MNYGVLLLGLCITLLVNIGPALIIRYGIKKRRLMKRSSAVLCALVIGIVSYTVFYFLSGYASGTPEAFYGIINYFILRPKKEENIKEEE